MGLSAPIHVLSAGSTVRGLRTLAPALSARIGRPIVVATDHGHNIGPAARAGLLDAHALLLPRDMIEELIAAGALAGPRTDLGAVATSAVVARGAAAPGVETMEGLRAALLRARRVLITTAPSGVHMTVVIGALGLRGEVEGKLMRFDKSADINAWLAREGDCDALGFGPTTEIVDVDGVTHGGLLPHEAQMVLPYAAAATAQAFGDADVRTLLAALTSADARAAFEATGMSYAAPSPAA